MKNLPWILIWLAFPMQSFAASDQDVEYEELFHPSVNHQNRIYNERLENTINQLPSDTRRPGTEYFRDGVSITTTNTHRSEMILGEKWEMDPETGVMDNHIVGVDGLITTTKAEGKFPLVRPGPNTVPVPQHGDEIFGERRHMTADVAHQFERHNRHIHDQPGSKSRTHRVVGAVGHPKHLVVEDIIIHTSPVGQSQPLVGVMHH